MKSTILVDTNVILDFLLHRVPFYDDANDIMTLCAQKEVYGYVAFHTISNLYYILRKYIDENQRRLLLHHLCNILCVTAANHDDVVKAIDNDSFHDFEDCLQDKCAVAVKADYIITRNVAVFAQSETAVLSPSDFLKL